MAEAVHPEVRGAGQTRPRPDTRSPDRPRPREPGFRMGSVSGIEIRVDWSLAIIFFLIVVNLGAGFFPAVHPGWAPVFRWGLAIVAAALFFSSVLAHELAHALVGRAKGVPIAGITLFLFGGVSRLKGEPKSAGTEFLMAIAGPIVSLGIGLVCTVLGASMAGAAVEAELALTQIGPTATLLLWLGVTNLILGVFNLLPGFPLDGGRVLRSIVWKITGDMTKATRFASSAGRALAVLLMLVGVMMAFGVRFPVLGGGFVQGLWLVLIGWFLNSAAINSYRMVVINELLGDVPVARLMRTELRPVSPTLPVSDLVDRHFMQTDQRCSPVVDGERLAGIVCMGDLRRVARDRWDATPVRAIMTGADDLTTVGPQESAGDALGKLVSGELDQVPVLEDGRLIGILRRADILRWLELHGSR